MIYLDHAAATPVSEKVLKAMQPYFGVDFFNPSAAYLPAKKVAMAYSEAKKGIARLIGAKEADLVITAGATEANNLAFTAISKDERFNKAPNSTPNQTAARVLYLETEHDSVRAVAKRHNGKAIKVLPSGIIDLADLQAKITDETELISISWVNNELGTIQPLSEVAEILKTIKLERMKRGVRRQLLLHSDASQALNLLDINVARFGINLLTLNAGKIYGPKGIGALYVSRGVKLHPLIVGGGQENGWRSGTENVPGVVGFEAAFSETKEHLRRNRKKYAEWRKILLNELVGYELINKKRSVDNFVVICYDGLDAERLIFLLEEREIYLATGAACAASKGEKSHVLKAIGLTDSQIRGSLRISLGETNTTKQIHEAAKIINEVVAQEKQRLKNEE